MIKKIFPHICGISLVIFAFGLQADESGLNINLQEGLKEAKRLCEQTIDPKISSLAKQAGYDLDKLCASVRDVKFTKKNIKDGAESAVLPRVSEEDKNKAEPHSAETETKQILQQPDSQEEKTPQKQLKLFGYDLFAGEPTTYQPDALVPVEPNYSLGPGDELRIQFYGKVNDYYEQTISRDGSISFPKIGPLSVAGLTFADAKGLIDRKVAEEYIGVNVSLSMGALRSIRVFVLGEAHKPGTYTVPALSTITNVLFLSGGISDIASMRNVQLKRGGKVRAVLDLYDLLLSGDRSKDLRLQAGDTIFIPTIKNTAAIDGQVRRPAIYEIKGKSTVRQLIELGGGLLPKAFRNRATIKRVDQSGFMTALDIDLNSETGLDTGIENGDLLEVGAVVEEQRSVVTLSGNLHHPGQFLWRDGLRISDLVQDASGLKPNTDLDFALLRREQLPTRKIITLSVDLAAVLADNKSPSNIKLLPRDELMIFSSIEDRSQLLETLLMELRLQSRAGDITQMVTINGTVQSPGDYPLTLDMTLTQLIAAAGGLLEQAYAKSIEITSFDFSNRQQVVSSHRSVNLAEITSGTQSDIVLQPYDRVTVRALPDYRETMTIKLAGEVLLPGSYTFLRGETLSDVIKRAGGLTDTAHVKAAVFTREILRQQEQQRLEELIGRIKSDIAAVNLEGEKSVDSENEQRILQQLDSQKALGRLVINLAEILAGSVEDIPLKDGDSLLIPEYSQEVLVMGEVPWPSAYQYDPQLAITDYIQMAGGVDVKADKDRIYVVRVDGSVRMPANSGWFKLRRMAVEPGDTVVVPMDMDRQRPMALWREASSIIYQLSLGAAAIKSF